MFDSKFFSDYGFGIIAIDIIAYDMQSELDRFLGIDPDKGKKISIY